MRGTIVLWRQVSLRHLRERRLRAVLTLGGIALGVGLLVAVSASSTTLIRSAQASARDLAGIAFIEVSAHDASGMRADILGRVRDIEGVALAAPLLRANVGMVAADEPIRTQLLGVTPELAELFSDRVGDPDFVHIDGGLLDAGDAVLLSEALHVRLAVAEQERVSITTPDGMATIDIAGRVSGPALTAVNGGEFALARLDLAQRLLHREGRVDSIYVTPEPGVDQAQLQDRVALAVNGVASVGPPGERLEAFESAFAPLISIVALGSGVGLVVAVFIVFNTIGMAVAERRREISTALLLGARHRQIAGALVSEAVALGLAGSLLGVAAGLGLAAVLLEPVLNAYAFVFPDTAANALTWSTMDIVWPLIGGLIVAIAGAFLAARRIRDSEPIEVLRPQSLEVPHTPPRQSRVRALRTLTVAALLGLGTGGLALYAASGIDELARPALALTVLGATVAILALIPMAVSRLAPLLIRTFKVRGRLAIAALIRYPRRTTVTVAALMLPAAMAIAIGAAIVSFERAAQDSAHGWHGAPLKISSESYGLLGSDQPLDTALVDDLLAVEEVDAVYPERDLLILVHGEPTALHAKPIARSLQEQPEPWISPLRADDTELREGLAAGEIVVSSFTATNLGLAPGDELTIPTPAGDRAFRVAGTYGDLTTLQAFFIEYDTFRSIWGDANADEFSLVLSPGANTTQVAERVRELINERQIPAEVLTQDEKVSAVLETVEALTALARAIQFAALAAAGVAVGNTLFTSVHDRRWQLALGRLIGMRGKDVGRSVTIEAGTVGLVGGTVAALLGIPLGIAMLALLRARFAWEITFQIPWAVTGTVFGIGMLIAVLAASYPRRYAARIPIVETLKGE